MNGKSKIVFFACSICLLFVLLSSTAIVATKTKIAGQTSEGSFGHATTEAIIDGGDHWWPFVDDVHARTNCNKTIKVYVKATIYDSNWECSSNKTEYDGKVRVDVDGMDRKAVRATGNHKVESLDYGNWSVNTTVSYNK